MSDHEEFRYISASLNTQAESENVFKAQDPFNKSWDSLKDYSGLDQNFRRRTARNIGKALELDSPAYMDAANTTPTGVDASSKAINPGTVFRNGYGLFDVITPPFNLYELANFYDKNKIQYQLDNPIVKANVIVVPKIISVRDSLKYLWKNATDINLARLKNICEEYELAHILDGSKWNEWENLASYLPRNIGFEAFSRKGKDFSIQDGEFEVWVKILDSRKPQEIPPIEYVEEQLKRMLLLSRKTKLLEEKKEDMFDIAKRKGQIEIFYLK